MSTSLQNLRSILKPKEISKLAYTYKFNQRTTGQITGFEFIKMLITHVGSGRKLSYESLNHTLSNNNPNINISTQALSKYFYKEASVQLIKAIYQSAFQRQKEFFFKKQKSDLGVLNHFQRILIHDSTICSLNKGLENEYPGSGGSASRASIKIDVIHELKSSTIISLTPSQANKMDVCFADLELEIAQKGDLVLRDLGYFKTKIFGDLDHKGIYFISRYKTDVSVYLTETCDSVDLNLILKNLFRASSEQVVELDVYLGPSKQKVRLIAYQVAEEVANKRRMRAKQIAVKGGGTPSKKKLGLCDYVILVTNIPISKVTKEVVGTIYRLRWGIELMFKMWKSTLNLQLNLSKGTNLRRLECVLYSMLLMCVLTAFVHSWLVRDRSLEISIDKLAKYLLNRNGYQKLLWGGVSQLQADLKNSMRMITKEKRNRKTTLERVINLEAYSKKYK